MITTFGRGLLRRACPKNSSIWAFSPLVSRSRQLQSTNQQQILLEEQHKDAEYRKKLKGQQGALLKTISPPESRHERLSIQKMKSAKEIIQYIKYNQFQHTSIYASAIKKCSELKESNAIKTIIDI
ncbi:hypothetical protein RFI_26903, partial [Reticulomyxa filosa]